MLDRFERFSASITEISRYWHKLASDEMAKYGLKGTHSIYLLTLYRNREGLKAQKLCELCERDKADVSRMMTIMEEKGLVGRTCSGPSRYRAVYFLTPSGIAAAEAVSRRAALAVELAGRDLTEESRKSFYESLESILNNLRHLSQNGLPEE